MRTNESRDIMWSAQAQLALFLGGSRSFRSLQTHSSPLHRFNDSCEVG
jgi:hypothetical protein